MDDILIDLDDAAIVFCIKEDYPVDLIGKHHSADPDPDQRCEEVQRCIDDFVHGYLGDDESQDSDVPRRRLPPPTATSFTLPSTTVLTYTSLFRSTLRPFLENASEAFFSRSVQKRNGGLGEVVQEKRARDFFRESRFSSRQTHERTAMETLSMESYASIVLYHGVEVAPMSLSEV